MYVLDGGAIFFIAWFSYLAYKSWLKHKLRELELRAMGRLPYPSSSGSTEIAALRNEIAQLRDTTTRYDMSVEQSLRELTRRIEVLEHDAGQAVHLKAATLHETDERTTAAVFHLQQR